MTQSELSEHSQLMLTKNLFKMVIIDSLPMVLGILAMTLQSFISYYFQSLYFKQEAIMAVNLSYNYYLIFGTAVPSQLMFFYALSVTNFAAYKEFDKMQEYYYILVRLCYISIPIFIIAGALLSVFLLPLFAISENFRVSIIVQTSLAFMFNFSNNMNVIKFTSEGRYLLVFSQLIFNAILRTGVESLLYFTFQKSIFPTFLAFIITELIMGSWMAFINEGRSIYGVTNKTPFLSDMKEIIGNFKNMNMKILQQMIRFAFPRTFIQISLPVTVLVAHVTINSTYRLVEDKYQGIYDLFTFSFFGQIYRVIPQSLAYMFYTAAALHYKQKYYKRIIRLAVVVILVSIVSNIIVYGIFSSINIPKIFSSINYFNENTWLNQILACVAGSLSIIPDLASILATFQGFTTLNYISAFFKVSVGIIACSILKRINGDRANYMYAMSFTEGMGVSIGCLFLILFSVKFYFFSKDDNEPKKGKSKNKK